MSSFGLARELNGQQWPVPVPPSSSTWLLVVVGVLASAWAVFVGRPEKPKQEDPRAWQRQIDREYRLEIEGSQVTVFHLDQLCTCFAFHDPVEIQLLSRRDEFPPLSWKVITPAGEFMLPDGGRYAREFTARFVYALPGYYDQRVAFVSPPAGFRSAMSLWRKNDPWPKRERSDEDIVDW